MLVLLRIIVAIISAAVLIPTVVGGVLLLVLEGEWTSIVLIVSGSAWVVPLYISITGKPL
jgi:uncharacterized membrane protein